jgi:ABC-type Co2+ transport system permease subunit
MHIEPGYVQPVKVVMANAGALTVLAWAAKEQIKDWAHAPWTFVKTGVAALAFTVFMQSFSAPVGPSELHFVGAMAMYLTLGFWPTLMGFAIGLGLQGLLFSPWDLVHLGVNSLSLMVPLLAVHFTMGKSLFDGALKRRLNFATMVKLDAAYYIGVTTMVGFWLWVGGVETTVSAWLAFAASYLVVVAAEPLLTYAVVGGLKKVQDTRLVQNLFVVNQLTTD